MIQEENYFLTYKINIDKNNTIKLFFNLILMSFLHTYSRYHEENKIKYFIFINIETHCSSWEYKDQNT